MKTHLIILGLLFSSTVFAEQDKPASEGNELNGEQIFNTFCADACHQAPDRSRLTARQWDTVLKTMQTRMQSAGMQPLNEDQNTRLLDYLSASE